MKNILLILSLLIAGLATASAVEIVTFPSGTLQLKAMVWKPDGAGPFPAILMNHGSGRNHQKQFEAIGPFFAGAGYVLIAPFRRGHGLSGDQGAFIGDVLDEVNKREGIDARSRMVIQLLEGDHLYDQQAAFDYLLKLPYVDAKRIAVAGVSFGGIQTMLMAERGGVVRTAVNFSGAALNWERSPLIRERMLEAGRRAKIPVYLIQAENDQSIAPSIDIAAEMQRLGVPHRMKIYPPFGKTVSEGHAFGYNGSAVWGPEVLAFLRETLK